MGMRITRSVDEDFKAGEEDYKAWGRGLQDVGKRITRRGEEDYKAWG